jgi:hypothetical protein
MRSLGTRRATLGAGAATVAVIALGGCSAGQVAETANLKAPVAGVNTASPDGGLLIRNLQVVYNNSMGYPANGSAPLEMSLFNQTQSPITVTISSKPLQNETAGLVTAQQVGLVGDASAASPSAAPEPSGSRPAATPISTASDTIEGPSSDPSSTGGASTAPADTAAAQPAKITIPALSSARFVPTGGGASSGGQGTLQAIGLSGDLRPGNSLSLVFQVSTSAQPLTLIAPLGVPLSPVSRAPGIEGESAEE